MTRHRAAALLLAAAALAGCGLPGGPRGRGAPAGPSPSPAAAIAAFVPQAEQFVERHRGLRFTAPVAVTLLGDAAFRARLRAVTSQKDRGELEKAAKELRAFGLVSPGVDIAKVQSAFEGAAVVGFYDARAGSLVVRGAAVTPYVREVLVHELTHALQDQHFHIDRPQLADAHDESDVAFTGLVEGDAVRIEDEYLDSLSDDERARAADEGSGGDVDSSIPRALVELAVFPYEEGPGFVRALVRARGQSGLDAAFTRPPTTTAELYEAQRYLRGERSQPVALPRADAPAFDDGVLGELGLQVILDQAVRSGRLGADDADRARQAWDGDRYVAWERGSTACVRDTLRAASGDGASSLVSALRKAGEGRDGFSLETGAVVTMTSCG